MTPTEDEGEDAEGSSPGKGEETEEGRIEVGDLITTSHDLTQKLIQYLLD